MPIIDTNPKEKRAYAKDPDLMSKSQFLKLRKPCTMPAKYADVDGIENEENEFMVRGTIVHTYIEDCLNYLKRTGGFKIENYEPYTDNFIKQYSDMTNGKFDIVPLHQEVVAKLGTQIGTLDQVWEMSDGDLAVTDIKTGKVPNAFSDIRIELAFYAELIDAKYIGAMFLGPSDKYPNGKFFFEPLNSRLLKRLHEGLAKAWEIRRKGAYVRKFGFQCVWCDYAPTCVQELTRKELLQFQENKFKHKAVK